MSTKKPLANKLRYLAMTLAFLAILVVLYNVGKPVMEPFSTSLTLNAPRAASSADGITAIIDGDSRRLLILNEHDELARVVSLDTSEVACDELVDVCVAHNHIYLAGVKHQTDSAFVQTERVLRYSSKGVFEQELYAFDRDEGNGIERSALLALAAADDGVYALSRSVEAETSDTAIVEIHHLPDVGNVDELVHSYPLSEELVSLGYSQQKDLLAGIDLMGLVLDVGDDGSIQVDPSVNGTYTCIDVDSSGRRYAYDDSVRAVVDLKTGGQVITGCEQVTSISAENEILVACDKPGRQVMVHNLALNTTRSISNIPYSSLQLSGTWLFWLSSSYLLLFVLAFIVMWAHKSLRKASVEGAGPKLAAIATIAALGVSGAMVIEYNWSKQLEVRINEVSMLCDHLEMAQKLLEDDYFTDGAEQQEDGSDSSKADAIQSFLNLGIELESLRLAASSHHINLFYRVYLLDDDSQLYHIANSSERSALLSRAVLGDNEQAVRDVLSEDKQQDLQVGRSVRGATVSSLLSYDVGELHLVIELGSELSLLEGALIGNSAELVVALLVGLLVIYLSYSELRACGSSLIVFKRLAGEHESDAAAMLTRPLSFFGTFMQGVDSVMMVLIARDLLDHEGLDASLVFVPALALGIGIAAGYFSYGLFAARVSLRRLLEAIVGAIALFSLATLGTVALGAFWLFSVAKFCVGVPFGMLYVACYLLPRRAESAEVRASVSSAVTSTDESAPALAAVVGGYVAQVLGDAWIYAVVALACVPLVLLVVWWNPTERGPVHKASPETRSQLMAFIRGMVPLGLVLFAVLPRAVMGGFSSFLFPMFASGAELSKSDISNFAAIGQLITYLSLGTLGEAKRRFDPWRMVCVGLAGASVVFMLLVFNHSITWSVAAIAIVALFRKMCTNWKGLWLKASDAAGIPEGVGMGTGLSFEGLANAGKPLFLGAFLALGQTGSVLALSAFCLLCLVGYVATTGNSVIAPKR